MMPVDLAQWRKKMEERGEAPTAARFRRHALRPPPSPWAQIAKQHCAHLRRRLFRQHSQHWKPPSPTAKLSQQFAHTYAPSFCAGPLLPRIELPPEMQALVGALETYELGDESAFWGFVNQWFIRGVTGRGADFHQRKELKRELPNLWHTPIGDIYVLLNHPERWADKGALERRRDAIRGKVRRYQSVRDGLREIAKYEGTGESDEQILGWLITDALSQRDARFFADEELVRTLTNYARREGRALQASGKLPEEAVWAQGEMPADDLSVEDANGAQRQFSATSPQEEELLARELAREDRRRLEDLKAGLPRFQREVLEHDLANLELEGAYSTKKTALRMGVTEGAVKSARSRNKRRIQECWRAP
jgi:DNA-directed RNA polymerase specialized sigma24 family protein